MGVILALVAGLIGSGKDIISKKVSATVDGNVSAFASFAFAVPFYLVILSIGLYTGTERLAVTAGFLWFVFARSFSDVFAESFKMYALGAGEFSSVVAIISLHPVISLLTSPLITHDPITFKMAIGVIVAVVGNIVILTSDRTLPSRKATVYGLLTAIFFSINTCFDRLSVQAGTPVMSGLCMNVLAGFFLIPTLYRKPTDPNQLNSGVALRQNVRPFLLRGFFEAMFMSVKLNSLRFLTGPELSAIMRVNLVFSVIGGNKLFHEVGFARKIVGALLTVAGIAIMIVK